MQGVFGGVFGLASVIGPTAGGFITDNWGWRWVFYVNIPVGVLGIALLAMFLPFVRTKASWRNIDFAGAGLLALALTPILIALSETTTYGWTSWQTLVPLIGGILILFVFVWVEFHEEEPIVPIQLFKNRAYAVSILIGFIMAFGMFGTIIFVPLIYQGVLGISATNSGALITPMMFGLIGASIVTGQLMVRIKHYQYLGTVGAAVTALGMFLLSEISIHSTQVEVTASLVFVGMGLGVTMPLYIQAVQSAVDRKFLGVVTSNIQFFRNVGGTIATAIFGSILASRLGPNIQTQVSALNLPAAFTNSFKIGGQSAQQIFNPANLAAARAALPETARPLFDQVIVAVKAGLAVRDVPDRHRGDPHLAGGLALHADGSAAGGEKAPWHQPGRRVTRPGNGSRGRRGNQRAGAGESLLETGGRVTVSRDAPAHPLRPQRRPENRLPGDRGRAHRPDLDPRHRFAARHGVGLAASGARA
jgi:predicted MFS family arabinose efflux permease